MGDSPPDPEPPYQKSSKRSSQVSEQRGSLDRSQPQPTTIPMEVQQMVDAEILLSTQEMLANQTRGWPQGAGLTQSENLTMSQAEEPQWSDIEYLPMNAGFPSEFQRHPYLDEDRIQATHSANLILQQLQQQGQGSLFQQLGSAYQEPQPDLLGQFSMYQREDLQFGGGTQPGPYIRDDPALQFSSSESDFMPFHMEVPAPEPRELAVQNAKTYLLQTSVNCDLSL